MPLHIKPLSFVMTKESTIEAYWWFPKCVGGGENDCKNIYIE